MFHHGATSIIVQRAVLFFAASSDVDILALDTHFDVICRYLMSQITFYFNGTSENHSCFLSSSYSMQFCRQCLRVELWKIVHNCPSSLTVLISHSVFIHCRSFLKKRGSPVGPGPVHWLGPALIESACMICVAVISDSPQDVLYYF